MEFIYIIVFQYDLTQHVKVFTRPISKTILDLILTSRPNTIRSMEVVTGMSDHGAVLLSPPSQVIINPHVKCTNTLVLTLMP